jgi:hypothetical protein
LVGYLGLGPSFLRPMLLMPLGCGRLGTVRWVGNPAVALRPVDHPGEGLREVGTVGQHDQHSIVGMDPRAARPSSAARAAAWAAAAGARGSLTWVTSWESRSATVRSPNHAATARAHQLAHACEGAHTPAPAAITAGL